MVFDRVPALLAITLLFFCRQARQITQDNIVINVLLGLPLVLPAA